MKQEKDRSEQALGATIVSHFTGLEWEVFQEVQTRQHGGIADIVLRQGRIVGVVECKRTLNLSVIEQAYEWLPYAHFVWTATWHSSPRGRLVYKILKDNGIGWLSVYGNDDPRESVKPAFRRAPPNLQLLTDCLTEQRRHVGAAGSARGGHWTPFRHTGWELERIAKESPGILLKDALDSFKHHYSSTKSAMCNLPEWIDKGKFPTIRLDRSDGRLRLVLADPAPEKNLVP